MTKRPLVILPGGNAVHLWKVLVLSHNISRELRKQWKKNAQQRKRFFLLKCFMSKKSCFPWPRMNQTSLPQNSSENERKVLIHHPLWEQNYKHIVIYTMFSGGGKISDTSKNLSTNHRAWQLTRKKSIDLTFNEWMFVLWEIHILHPGTLYNLKI